MGWGFVWMMVVLKIPVIALLYLVYWAVKQTDAEAELPSDGGGGSDRHPHRGHGPRRPRPPRRGPHAAAPPRPPSRVRASGRQLARPLR
ncbi:MAG TPA: hypothetical protein VF712_17275 [Thermoleophilaceae bacterium]|jgi:hypothetical protein